MENASKALLIAGGILLLIILVSLMLFVKGTISDYYASEQALEDIADTAKFNEQFSRFNREDVQGYELISLINKVVDYNERLSTETTNGNDVQAKPITVTITLWGGSTGFAKNDDKVTDLTFDETWRLFTDAKTTGTITQSNSKNQLENIIGGIKEIESNNKYISVLTKKIRSIIVNSSLTSYPLLNEEGTSIITWKKNGTLNEEADIQNMLKAISSYQAAVDNNTKYKPVNETYDEVKKAYGTMILDNSQDMYQYYEYTQFRKAYFKCTNIDYDPQSGKVIRLGFVYTGKIE